MAKNFAPLNYGEQSTTLARRASAYLKNIFMLLLLSSLVGCYATTDEPAYYPNDMLSKEQVGELTGHYHIIQLNGTVSSISFTPRDEFWHYDVEQSWFNALPFVPKKLGQAPTAKVNIAELAVYESGDKSPWQLDGIAIFSHIPGTELILASLSGKTAQFTNEEGTQGPLGEKYNSRNLFFIIDQSGKAVAIKLFSESNKALKSVFGDPKKPLPTAKLLSYLEKNATSIMQQEGLPTYLRSTAAQKDLITRNFNAAFIENKEKATLARREKAQKKAQEEAKKKRAEARQKKAQENKRKQAARIPLHIPPKKITSIDGYYAVGPNGIDALEKRSTEANGAEEYRGYIWKRNRFTGLYQRGDYLVQGYWYSDSQQFYSQGWFKGQCSRWSEAFWGFPLKFEKKSVAGRTIEVWYPSTQAVNHLSAKRKKKAICTNQKINTNICTVVRCNKMSDPNKAANIFYVRSNADAKWLYKHLF